MKPSFYLILVISFLGILSATKAQDMKLSSPEFQNGQPLPEKAAYRKQNVSPELVIEGVPPKAQSLALIVDDPDAPRGNWDHWIVWNIPPATARIAQGSTPAGATMGRNDFGETRYDGPAPPSGTHHYHFKLFALDTTLNLKAGASRKELESAMKGHVLAEADLVGTYASK